MFRSSMISQTGGGFKPAVAPRECAWDKRAGRMRMQDLKVVHATLLGSSQDPQHATRLAELETSFSFRIVT